jgi:hypothetical protein
MHCVRHAHSVFAPLEMTFPSLSPGIKKANAAARCGIETVSLCALRVITKATRQPEVLLVIGTSPCDRRYVLDFKNLKDVVLWGEAISTPVFQQPRVREQVRSPGFLSSSWGERRSQPAAYGFGHPLRLPKETDLILSHQGSELRAFKLAHLPGLLPVKQPAQAVVGLGFHS